MTRVLLLLVVVIVVLRVARALMARAGAVRAPAAPPTWNPHAVLGVAPGASRDEIAQAYRGQLKRYHPDRVADLGPELQRVAHQKTVDLQRAYAELTG